MFVVSLVYRALCIFSVSRVACLFPLPFKVLSGNSGVILAISDCFLPQPGTGTLKPLIQELGQASLSDWMRLKRDEMSFLRSCSLRCRDRFSVE